jgi:hypothetical protein
MANDILDPFFFPLANLTSFGGRKSIHLKEQTDFIFLSLFFSKFFILQKVVNSRRPQKKNFYTLKENTILQNKNLLG